MTRDLRSWLVLAGIAALAAGVAILATRYLAILTELERDVQDVAIATLSPREPLDPHVVIVAVTEDTLAQFPYRSPVDRQFLSDLLHTLDAKKPAVIGLDVLFDQPTEPAKDAALKATLREVATPLVVSYTEDPAKVDADQLAYLDAFVPHGVRAWANLNVDPVDGVMRWIFPGAPGKDGAWLQGFAPAVARRAGVAGEATDEEIAWHGRPDRGTPAFWFYPAHLVGALPAALFAGKIVLIGEVVSLTDRHRTPLSRAAGGAEDDLSGIEIQAHAVAQLVEGRHARHLGVAVEIALVALLAIVGVGFGLVNRGLVRHLALGAVALLVLWACGFALVWRTGVTMPLVEPSLAFVMATWGADAVIGRQARRQREFIQSAFSLYVNPETVKRLADDPAQLKLGGEMRQMTLMFCDIRGFTAISEQYDAQGLTHFINRFMTPMTAAILASGGTIDKYIGDAIMAFWNAPLEDPAHGEHACRAALAMRGALVRFNAGMRAAAEAEGRSFATVRIGIGVNTGECCVGNVGSDQRFNYSVLGDDVNLCSRLEGQCKTYGVDIIVGEKTVDDFPALAFLELDRVRVKGKLQPVAIFALVGDEAVASSAEFRSLEAAHEAMLAAYRARDWRTARLHVRACLAEAPELMLAAYALYAERIDDFEATPPPVDWDGVYVALEK
jgi:class 3 adenylate cyclase/CHASE2 domain-containing sensor protein